MTINDIEPDINVYVPVHFPDRVYVCSKNSKSNLNQQIMNALRNRVQLIGNLGQNPELKTLENGKKVTRFTLATSEEYKNAEGQKIKETTWHNIVAWNKLADITEKYLKKGRQVAVDGRIAYRTYEDKKGVTKNITEIILNDLLFLASPRTDDKEE